MPDEHAPGTLFAASAAESEREKLLAHFKHLTEVALPARAHAERWPIRYDHCFKRICLDHAFGDIWYKHLRKPAERYLTGEPLNRAIECATGLLTGNVELLSTQNQASLQWRGKLRG